MNQSVFHIVTHQETGRLSYISATVASEESRICCGITIRLTDCIENFDDSGFVAGPRFGQPQVNLSTVRATLREVEEAFDELSGILRMAVTEHAHSLATALADASKTKDAFLDKDVGAFVQFVVPYQKVGSEMQMAIVDRIQGVVSTLHAVHEAAKLRPFVTRQQFVQDQGNPLADDPMVLCAVNPDGSCVVRCRRRCPLP